MQWAGNFLHMYLYMYTYVCMCMHKRKYLSSGSRGCSFSETGFSMSPEFGTQTGSFFGSTHFPNQFLRASTCRHSWHGERNFWLPCVPQVVLGTAGVSITPSGMVLLRVPLRKPRGVPFAHSFQTHLRTVRSHLATSKAL